MKALLASLSIFLLSLACLDACDARGGDHQAESNLETTAKNRASLGTLLSPIDDEITPQDLEAFLRFRGDHYTTQARRDPALAKQALRDLVNEELLFREALRRGLQREPGVRQQIRALIVQHLTARLLRAEKGPRGISEQEVQAAYEQDRDRYHQPEKVRTSRILVAKLSEAERLAGLLRASPRDLRLFESLARQHGIDPRDRQRAGDLGFFSREEAGLPPEVVQAAFSIRGMWEVAGPLKTRQGWVMLMKTGYRPAFSRPLALERDRIRRELLEKRRGQALQNLLQDLRKKTTIRVRAESPAASGKS